jgi:hypothetical protein
MPYSFRPLFWLRRSALSLACVVAPVASAAQWQHAPLLRALSLLTPTSYRVEVDRQIPTSTVLRWMNVGDWQSRLENAAQRAGLSVRIDADRHVVTVFSSAKEEGRVQRVALQNLSGADEGSSYSAHDETLRQAWSAPAPLAPAGRVRLIDAVETLIPNWRNAQGQSIGLEVLAADLDTPVRWDSSLSRWDALQAMLSPLGLSAQMRGNTLRIAPVQGPRTTYGPAFPSRYSAAGGETPAVFVGGLDLMAGQPVGQQMKKQAAAQGWTVVWDVNRDWLVPSNTQISGTIDKAIAAAVRAMAEQGAPIHATVYTANRTIVIAQNGDRSK